MKSLTEGQLHDLLRMSYTMGIKALGEGKVSYSTETKIVSIPQKSLDEMIAERQKLIDGV